MALSRDCVTLVTCGVETCREPGVGADENGDSSWPDEGGEALEELDRLGQAAQQVGTEHRVELAQAAMHSGVLFWRWSS